MSSDPMRTLVTNDDGIHSAGLQQLEVALREIADVYTVAPMSEMSGASHSLTLSRPLRIRRIDERHWAVDGTPTDCVLLALNQILPPEERPHLCVSGINYGANLGEDVSYSGTVAGALEASVLGLPAIAVSLATRENFDFTPAAQYALAAAQMVLANGLPPGVFLNLNVPPGTPRGALVTWQGLKNARPVISEHRDPRGKAYYWIGQQLYDKRADPGTDYHAVENGYVSITPLRSEMTDHRALELIQPWNGLTIPVTVTK